MRVGEWLVLEAYGEMVREDFYGLEFVAKMHEGCKRQLGACRDSQHSALTGC